MSLATVCAVVGRTAVGLAAAARGQTGGGAAALNFLLQAAGSVALLAGGRHQRAAG